MGRPQLPPPPLLEPSWYPDPTGRYEARYWDGRRWTSHISHYGATGTDPLIRAKLDRFWIRWIGRVVVWGGLALAALWAYEEYWPTDDRDIAVDEGILEAATLVRSDVPEGFGATTRVPLSPQWLVIDDDGAGDAVDPEECAPLEPEIARASDDPKDANAFADDVGSTIENAMVVAGTAGDADAYLAAMRSDEAGSCLAALWAAHLVAENPNATVTTLVARAMAEPAFGDRSVWWRLSASIEGGAFPIAVFADVIVVKVDRVTSEYVFESLAQAIGVDVHRDTIRPHLSRVRAAVERVDGVDADDPAGDGSDADGS